MKTLRFFTAVMLAVLALQPTMRAAVYKVGDTVENISLINRATGKPVQLTDFAGKIVLLDWFAWWCPYCQAAAPQLLSGIDQWYAARGGNPAGLPVVHVGVNLQPSQETQTQNFVNRAGLELVLQDFNRAFANRIAADGQPIFAIINGVTNSASHRPWELLYSRLGHGETSFPVADFRAAIDAVKAPAVTPTTPPVLSNPTLSTGGLFSFVFEGQSGRSYRLDSSADLLNWQPEKTITAAGGKEVIQATAGASGLQRYFRAVVP